ncbi:TetR/AcrR family transcriptional regulator [Nocardia brasiliensis]|uniref:TetR/AcrR family transcriptional regulator n=1 Tax=Nocardia brasiliensis TaxID=37326 RepID=UPI001893EFDD|nr:TetR/AcrR family transcriptional regulator [Nocardia brasiliensis]MBF6542391.1 TetR family transcriptional regulator [Nocardia brasiliensis]
MTTDRRTLLLDTAIALIAEQGLRGLTHRAVQEAAGLKHGSVTYYFKSRDQLVLAVIDRIIDLDKQRSSAVVHELMRTLATRPPAGLDFEQLAALLADWWTQSRDLLLARYELDLAGARDPRLREAMSHCGAEFRRLAELVAEAAGSADPALDGAVLTNLIDGLMFDFITRPPHHPEHLTRGLRHAITSISPV